MKAGEYVISLIFLGKKQRFNSVLKQGSYFEGKKANIIIGLINR